MPHKLCKGHVKTTFGTSIWACWTCVKFQVSWPSLKALWPNFQVLQIWKKRKGNRTFWCHFPKTGNQMGSFGQIRKNSFLRFCRPILDIFGFTLLTHWHRWLNTRLTWCLVFDLLYCKPTEKWQESLLDHSFVSLWRGQLDILSIKFLLYPVGNTAKNIFPID